MCRRALIALALLSVLPGPATGEELNQQQPLRFDIAESSPGLSGQLAVGGQILIRLTYQSNVPVRFRPEAYAAAQKVTAGASHNIAPPYPAGKGEALVWMSFEHPTTIDEIRIGAFDDRWKPLASISTPVRLAWSEHAPHQPMPSWAARLNREQQDIGRQRSRDESEQYARQGSVSMGVAAISILGYALLQVLLPILFSGAWRLAALAPLLGTVPLAVHAALALNAGSKSLADLVDLVRAGRLSLFVDRRCRALERPTNGPDIAVVSGDGVPRCQQNPGARPRRRRNWSARAAKGARCATKAGLRKLGGLKTKSDACPGCGAA